MTAETTFQVLERTRNLARARAAPSVTVYLLSADRRPDARDLLVGSRKVRRLRRHRASTARVSLRVPAATPSRRYWLIACAGVRSRRYARAACRVARHSFALLPASPSAGGVPAVIGDARYGQTLRGDAGIWRGVPPIATTLRWRRCDRGGGNCQDVGRGDSYVLTAADIGSTLRVTVAAHNRYGDTMADSPQTAPVAAVPPVATAAPVAAGRAVPGGTVNTSTGSWRGSPGLAYAYQWQRCTAGGDCTDIPGATDSAYTLTDADVGGPLRVTVTATDDGGSARATSAPLATGAYQNSVYDGHSPDPFVVDVDSAHDDYLEFNTGELFPMLRSRDLIHWEPAGQALADRPAWVVQSGDWNPWAPSVIATDAACPGESTGPCYVMYHVGLSAAFGVHCIGVATARVPGGPYVPYADAPLSRPGAGGEPVGCGDANGQGNIDPSPFVDSDGRAYLYVSTDFTGGQLAPTISVIPLASDLVHASAGRTPLVSGAAGGWEAAGAPAPTVEGPAVVKHAGDYYLLYSGGSWITTYAMGYARSSTATGGFVKPAGGPILAAHGSVYSPGGADRPVVGPHGDTWLVYHARDGGYDAHRSLHVDRFAWRPGADGHDVPVIEGPTETPQPTGP